MGEISESIYSKLPFVLFSLVISLVDSWSVKLGKLFSKVPEVEKS